MAAPQSAAVPLSPTMVARQWPPSSPPLGSWRNARNRASSPRQAEEAVGVYLGVRSGSQAPQSPALGTSRSSPKILAGSGLYPPPSPPAVTRSVQEMLAGRRAQPGSGSHSLRSTQPLPRSPQATQKSPALPLAPPEVPQLAVAGASLPRTRSLPPGGSVVLVRGRSPAATATAPVAPVAHVPHHAATVTAPPASLRVPSPLLHKCGSIDDERWSQDAKWQTKLAEVEQRRAADVLRLEFRLTRLTSELQALREEAERRRQAEVQVLEQRLASCNVELRQARDEVLRLKASLAAATSGVSTGTSNTWSPGSSPEAMELTRHLEAVERELREARATGEARLAVADAASRERLRCLEQEMREAGEAAELRKAQAVAEVRSSCEEALLDLCNLHTEQLQERELKYEATMARRDEELFAARVEVERRASVDTVSTTEVPGIPGSTERALVELCEMHDEELRRREAQFEAALLQKEQELAELRMEAQSPKSNGSGPRSPVRSALKTQKLVKVSSMTEILPPLGRRELSSVTQVPEELAQDWARKETASLRDLQASLREEEEMMGSPDWSKRATVHQARTLEVPPEVTSARLSGASEPEVAGGPCKADQVPSPESPRRARQRATVAVASDLEARRPTLPVVPLLGSQADYDDEH